LQVIRDRRGAAATDRISWGRYESTCQPDWSNEVGDQLAGQSYSELSGQGGDEQHVTVGIATHRSSDRAQRGQRRWR
jgi:hypothetical protein